MNVLDELFPFTRVNSATFPDVNGPMKAGTPGVDEPQYDERVLEYVRTNAPDAFAGQPVGFQETFFGLITPQMAGTSDAGLVAMTNLEVWGAPSSANWLCRPNELPGTDLTYAFEIG